MTEPPVVGGFDLPEPRSIFGGGANLISGWAHGRDCPVSSVEISLDGVPLGRAGLGRLRPDVAAALGDPDAEMAGFEMHANIGRPPATTGGTGTLSATVTLADGHEAHLAPRQVVVPAQLARAEASTAGYPERARAPRGERIRVLWAARGLDHGGSQLRMAENVAMVAGAGGFEVTVLSPAEGPLRPRLEAAGVEVLVGAPAPLDDVVGYERWAADLAGLVEGRFDLVVGATVTSFPAVDVGCRLGIPSVLRVGEVEPLRTVVAWIYGPLDDQVEERARQAFRGASAVITLSRLAEQIYRADGFEAEYHLVRHAIDVEGATAAMGRLDREECRRRLGVAPQELLVVCAGAQWPVKGQYVLARAVELAREAQPELGCALLGGPGAGTGAYAAALRGLVTRNGLEDSIRIEPFVSPLWSWWRAADAGVCCSESETMPAALAEAMSCGLPVVATRVGDIPDVVEDGRSGWLCNASDVRDLARALAQLGRTTREELEAMGRIARATVERDFNRRDVERRLLDLLERVASGS
jgi:glycosyltransferase involved in cell wall biosynthesis